METEKLNSIRQGIESLARTAETLASEADDFPAVLQNTKRLSALHPHDGNGIGSSHHEP